jgi:hypothetical protein
VDEKRTDLRAALRDLAAEESGDAGPHIGLKRLIAYRQGTLPAAEREALQEHLSLCTRCTGLLAELRDFEAASARGDAAGPESLRQEAWDSLARRLPGITPAVRPVATLAPRRRPVSYLLYSAAAALLLAVIGVAVWSAAAVRQERARLTQRLEEREEALAAARRSLADAERQLAAARGSIQDLENKRTGGREEELEARVAELTSALEELRRTARAPGGGDGQLAASSRDIDLLIAPKFALRGEKESEFLRASTMNRLRQADRLTAALQLGSHPVYGEYRFELTDKNGEVLWSGRRPGRSVLGDAGTSVSIRGLGPGRYWLRVEGLYPDRTALLAEYLLEVEPLR